MRITMLPSRQHRRARAGATQGGVMKKLLAALFCAHCGLASAQTAQDLLNDEIGRASCRERVYSNV